MLRSVLAITDVTLSRLPLDDFLAELLSRARAAVGADAAAILLREGERLAPRAASGCDVDPGARLPIEGSFEGRVLTTNEAVAVPDRSRVANAISALPESIRSLFGVPLRTGDEVRGVLVVGRKRPGRFGESQRQLAEIAADRAATALEKARLAERLAAADRWRADIAFFNMVQRESAIGLALFDTSLRYVWANARISEIDGRPMAEYAGRTVQDVIPALASRVETLLRSVRDTRQPIRGVELIGETPARPGQPRHWVASYLPVTAGDGRLLGIGCVVEEVREWGATEVALRESETMYRTLLDNMTQRVIYKNRDSIYIAINPAYAEDIGVSPDEVAGKTDFDFNPPEAAEKYRADDRRIMAAGVVEEFDEPYVVHGRTLTIHTVKAPVRDARGNVVGVLVIFWDITEQKQAEETLRRSEQRMRLFIEQTPLGVIEWDTDFRVVRWNPAAERIFGYTAAEAIGRHASFIVPAGLRVLVNDVMMSLLRLQGGLRSTNANLTKDGRVITCEWYNAPLTIGGPEAVGIVSLVDDVTEEVRARARARADAIRLATIADLGQIRATSLTVPEICELVMSRSIEITNSEYGYLFLYDEETQILTNYAWSKGVLPICTTEERQLIYPLAKTGLWGEAVRQRRPIITNDYAAPDPLKKGYPEGHVHIDRHMNLPVFDGDRIVAVVGVANKPEPYDEDDLRQLQMLMQGAWQIVQRTRGEEALRESEERFRAIFEQAAVGIVQVDPKGYFIRVNQRYCEIVGHSHDELLQRTMMEITHPDDLAITVARFDELLAGLVATYTIEKRYLRLDGSPIWVSLTASAIRGASDEPRYVIGVIQDISERKAVEAERERLLAEQVQARRRIEELAETAQRRAAEFQSIFDSATEGIVVFEAAGHVILVNGAASQILGVTADALVGLDAAKLPDLLRMRYTDGRPYRASEMAISAALGGESVVGREQLVWNAATQRDVNLRFGVAPIRAPSGDVVGAVIAFQDVTALSELDRLKDQFISVAAHELKTPVTIMKGYAQTLQRSGSGLSEGQRRMLDSIVRGANRMDRTIVELLDVSRLSLGHLDLKARKVDLVALVAELVERTDVATPQHRVRLIGAESAIVRADPDRIEQVIVNLLDNAVLYSPQGGDVDVGVEVSGDEAVVSVADHGIGIPSDQQARVFERLFRAHTGTPYDYGGIGASLYISREIVQRHGGRIWFESSEGKGSTFHFSLPLASEQPDR